VCVDFGATFGIDESDWKPFTLFDGTEWYVSSR